MGNDELVIKIDVTGIEPEVETFMSEFELFMAKSGKQESEANLTYRFCDECEFYERCVHGKVHRDKVDSKHACKWFTEKDPQPMPPDETRSTFNCSEDYFEKRVSESPLFDFDIFTCKICGWRFRSSVNDSDLKSSVLDKMRDHVYLKHK